MEPENIRFGGGSAVTVLHPLVAVAMILAAVLILCFPRKYVIIPAFLALFLIPLGQVIVAAGIHFNVSRIIILTGLARWAVSRRSSPLAGGFNSMDRMFTLWAVSYLIIYSLQWMNAQALIKTIGDFLDAMGGYFFIRFLIQDREDVRRAIKVLAAVAIVNAVCMLNEQRTGADVFALLGGMIGEVVRDGKIRSQGSFSIFITAGSFGATLPPLFVWLWSDGKSKMISFLGLVAATVMSVTCYASTTLIAYAAGILGLCLWPVRKKMRIIRWGIVAILVGLHLVMHGPVWSLIEHIDLTGSSSSYHRYMLIDNFIRHFGDWWLLGTRNNGSWGWEMWDTSNQYVSYGLTGGLLTFMLFISIISAGFAHLGTARKVAEDNRSEEWFLWCVGATLFSHMVAFFGIAYFDQVQFAWFALLAIISAAVFGAASSAVPQVQDPLTPSYQAPSASGWYMQKTKSAR
jgi:hypothetical protein